MGLPLDTVQSRSPRRRWLVYSFAITLPTGVDSFLDPVALQFDENPAIDRTSGNLLLSFLSQALVPAERLYEAEQIVLGFAEMLMRRFLK
jgi:hypothetical protein